MQAFKQGNSPTQCNQFLPNDNVYHRFLYILQVRLPGTRMQPAQAEASSGLRGSGSSIPFYRTSLS